jgi:hypothetical protein
MNLVIILQSNHNNWSAGVIDRAGLRRPKRATELELWITEKAVSLENEISAFEFIFSADLGTKSGSL